jgi:hypothetical protein
VYNPWRENAADKVGCNRPYPKKEPMNIQGRIVLDVLCLILGAIFFVSCPKWFAFFVISPGSIIYAIAAFFNPLALLRWQAKHHVYHRDYGMINLNDTLEQQQRVVDWYRRDIQFSGCLLFCGGVILFVGLSIELVTTKDFRCDPMWDRPNVVAPGVSPAPKSK